MANYSNQTADSIVTGTSAADIIYNYGSRATVNAGAGNDSIYNVGGASGGDYDTLSNYTQGYSAVLNGGAGNDSIVNTAPLVTIDGGDGDDTIDNYGRGNNISSIVNGTYQ